MKVLPISIYGDPVLRQKTIPADHVDEHIRSLAADMIHTMHAHSGVGLAAPQVGELVSVIVVDPFRDEDKSEAMALMNPDIYEIKGETVQEEGCLSIPEVTVEISRPESISVRFLSLEGEKVEMHYDGLLARVIQHEVDHLQGKLIVDYLTPLERRLVRNKLRKMASGEAAVRG